MGWKIKWKTGYTMNNVARIVLAFETGLVVGVLVNGVNFSGVTQHRVSVSQQVAVGSVEVIDKDCDEPARRTPQNRRPSWYRLPQLHRAGETTAPCPKEGREKGPQKRGKTIPLPPVPSAPLPSPTPGPIPWTYHSGRRPWTGS